MNMTAEAGTHHHQGRAGVLPLGLLERGTPFEMASTPVIAAPPDANAWSSRKTPAAPSAWSSAGSSTGAWCRWPVAALAMPTPIITNIEIEEQVGGDGEDLPGLLDAAEVAPRDHRHEGHRHGTRYGRIAGKAENRAATPADTDTATVRM